MKDRIPELDGIRGLAILLVVGWHYVWWNLIEDPATHVYAKPFAVWGSGVDLFFVLSGFLIAGILLDHQSSPSYFRAFYLRRAFRILPVYWLVFLPFIAAHLFRMRLENDTIPLWTYALFLQNVTLLSGGHWWMGATWSLAVEEQFYSTLPVLAKRLSRSVLAKGAITIILTSPVVRLAFLLFYPIPYFQRWEPLWSFTPCRADTLAMGVLLAILLRDEKFRRAATPRKIYAALGLVGALNVWQLYAGWDLRWIRCGTWGMTIIALLYALLILAAVGIPDGPIARIFRCRFLIVAGSLSYMVYMIHAQAFMFLHMFIRHSSYVGCREHLDDLWMAVLALIFSLTVALFSRRWFEGPLIQYARRFKY